MLTHEKLRMWRLEEGLTQDQAAERVGIEGEARNLQWSKLERGETKVRRLDRAVLAKILEEMRLERDEFFDETQPYPPTKKNPVTKLTDGEVAVLEYARGLDPDDPQCRTALDRLKMRWFEPLMQQLDDYKSRLATPGPMTRSHPTEAEERAARGPGRKNNAAG
jgi:transcriptional regulator with XRE-family HTH domain